MKTKNKWLIILGIIIFVLIGFKYTLNENIKNEQYTKLDNNEWQHFLLDHEFSSLLVNQEWIYAGGANGLFRIHQKTNEIEEITVDGKALRMVRALLLDDTDRLWVGHQAGLIIYDQTPIIIGVDDGLLNSQVLDILQTDSGKFEVATFNGIAIIENDAVKTFIQEADYLPGVTIKSLYKDSRGFIWYGAYSAIGGGVSCKRNNDINTFSINNGLVHNNITSIIETPEGEILIGAGLHTKGGANVLTFTDENWNIRETITVEEGLAGTKVRYIFIDSKGYKWFCSEYDGVAIMKGWDPVLYIDKESGLSHNEVKRIITDDVGNLWLGTKSGITYIPVNSLGALLYNKE